MLHVRHSAAAHLQDNIHDSNIYTTSCGQFIFSVPAEAWEGHTAAVRMTLEGERCHYLLMNRYWMNCLWGKLQPYGIGGLRYSDPTSGRLPTKHFIIFVQSTVTIFQHLTLYHSVSLHCSIVPFEVQNWCRRSELQCFTCIYSSSWVSYLNFNTWVIAPRFMKYIGTLPANEVNNSTGKMCCLQPIDILEVIFTSHHICSCYDHVIWGQCYGLSHSYTNVIPGHAGCYPRKKLDRQTWMSP